jgi:UDPglucose 6-dehydrogenase
VRNSDSIVILTEWDQFLQYDYHKLRKMMNEDNTMVYDLRSYMNKEMLIEAGFNYVLKLGEGKPYMSNDLRV